VVLEELRAENGSLRSQLNEAVRRLELAQRAFSSAQPLADSGEVARLQHHIKQLESEVVATMVRLTTSEKERMELEQRLRELGR
jgi:chromosome segregation ATPase